MKAVPIVMGEAVGARAQVAVVTSLLGFSLLYSNLDNRKDPTSGYIATYDLPKIANLKTMFATQYRADPVLVASRGMAKRN